MANKIIIKKSSVAAKVPVAGDLEIGELAVNLADAKLYTKNASGTVIQLGGGSGSGDVVGPATATDNALARFDGTTGKLIQNSVLTADDTGNAAGILSQQFSDGTAVTLAAGKQWYNGTNGSWNLGMGGGNITQQVGEELFRYGKASAAITDSPLQLIYKTGVVGGSGVITFAPAVAGIVDYDQILGCATENIALNGFGRITTYGIVNNITTNGTAYGETWADNDDIYYNPTTGGLTKVVPTAPALKLLIGTVITAGSGGSGKFIVKLGVATALGELNDVQITSPAAGHVITYNQTQGAWQNRLLTDGTGINITEALSGAITIANTGVTSVAMTVPTGLSIAGSPVTTTGTLAVTLTAGYSIPTTASQTNWDTAYTDRLKWDGGATGLVAATGRTSLGATTIGGNMFTLTNPSAITFPRFNADNTVSALDAATFRSAIGAGTSSTTGTVTSVAMTVPTGLSIAGTPITTSGTLALTLTAGYSIPTTASQTNWDSAYTQRLQWDGGATNLVAATGRASLGGTTVGQNFFTLTNPTAITFPRINADNTVSALDAATFRTAIGAGTSSTTGTVTSVGGTGTVSGLTLSGTVTTSGNLTLGGTLAVTASNFASQTANTFLAAPNGAAGTPTFRTIVAADVPTLNQNTTGSSSSCTGNAATASNASLLNSISAVNLYNNMGQIHSTSTSFDAQGTALTRDFGWRFVQGNVNSPNGSYSQYYSNIVGLGSEYPYNQYAMQIAYPRNTTTPYVYLRYEEGGVLGAWQKFSAGYADSAGSVTNSLSAGTGLSGSAFNGSGAVTWTLATSGVSANTYGSSSAVPVITVDTYGRITSATTAAVSGGQYFGTAATKAIAYNANSIAENITVTAGNNGLSAGPITINTGFTVTVQTGANWVIV
jgi:hypothetical protein